ncbi:hypothetical protein LWI29_026088 [Acer saccharum]|uniref:Uncharacterized protein n=1 Tax=Acer saccharum TaxID=4024 RepID=A0AA39T6I6_ACESA|nr:hypothetical protein LWI29_026088 [Acer saccharum]
MRFPWVNLKMTRVRVRSNSTIVGWRTVNSCYKLRKDGRGVGLKEQAEVDRKAILVGWSEELRQERLIILGEMWKGVRRDEQKWSQKSKVQWLKEGDKNTKFFHCLANGRKRMNFIGEIVIEGRKVSKPSEVKEGIAKYFRNHFRKRIEHCPDLRVSNLKRLSE